MYKDEIQNGTYNVDMNYFQGSDNHYMQNMLF